MRTINFSTETVKSYNYSLFPIPYSLHSPVDFRFGARSQFKGNVEFEQMAAEWQAERANNTNDE